MPLTRERKLRQAGRLKLASRLLAANSAAGLKVKAGAMAPLARRTYRLASGRIAQVAVNTHPASRCRQPMTMRRVKK